MARDKRMGLSLSPADYDALVALGAATNTPPAVLAQQIVHKYLTENSESVNKARKIYEQLKGLQLKLPGFED